MTARGPASPVVSRGLAILFVVASVLFAASCARRPPVTRRAPASMPRSPAPAKLPLPALPGFYFEEGLASWYGVPYHGRRAANGEIFNMHNLTAAHRTLPFDSIVRVTNLDNGRRTEVRINDRGPFVEGRVIDLSFAAAQAIDMVGLGVAQVRLEMISGPHSLAGQFTVQVGAFLEKENAVRLRRGLERSYQPVFIFEHDSPKGLFYRVRVGRLASEDRARHLAERLKREERVMPFVVRLDE